jgi:hypothetical protein
MSVTAMGTVAARATTVTRTIARWLGVFAVRYATGLPNLPESPIDWKITGFAGSFPDPRGGECRPRTEKSAANAVPVQKKSAANAGPVLE